MQTCTETKNENTPSARDSTGYDQNDQLVEPMIIHVNPIKKTQDFSKTSYAVNRQTWRNINSEQEGDLQSNNFQFKIPDQVNYSVIKPGTAGKPG